jgi:hypothetical protein
VADLPGLSYAWNRDETQLHLTYDSPDRGQVTFSAHLEDDVFRDDRGRVVGQVLSDGSIAIDTAALSAIWHETMTRNSVRHRVLTGPVAASEAVTTKTM